MAQALGRSEAIRGRVRTCGAADRPAMLRIINAAAGAYRGVIPAECWHEPYMTEPELVRAMAEGVVFSGFEGPHGLVGIMGLQRSRNLDLVRHAYVLPSLQGQGVGTALIRHIGREWTAPVLVGTWRAATWAIRFYERHGFAPVGEQAGPALLRGYWAVPERQIGPSTVLSAPPMEPGEAARLIAASCP